MIILIKMIYFITIFFDNYFFFFNNIYKYINTFFSIGRNIVHLINRPDDTYCFRLHNNRVYYVR